MSRKRQVRVRYEATVEVQIEDESAITRATENEDRFRETHCAFVSEDEVLEHINLPGSREHGVTGIATTPLDGDLYHVELDEGPPRRGHYLEEEIERITHEEADEINTGAGGGS